ncbi:hypothetical protein H4219_005149 [Mycoemilia scoparia]|uniref:Small nuclear ribonucleoprotein G n=1 Tax=Mycoemilia scoparia TaxID=417184 RepID=A0A9W7ZYQ8_9FUNG|nr:hypothetical protein H4219_005149 [Mycoemilia scoparia]
MVKAQLPELKKQVKRNKLIKDILTNYSNNNNNNNNNRYMEKKLRIQLNGSRKVEGVLRGYDAFMNIVMDDLYEIKGDERIPLGTSVIRGNSIVILELAEAMY